MKSMSDIVKYKYNGIAPMYFYRNGDSVSNLVAKGKDPRTNPRNV